MWPGFDSQTRCRCLMWVKYVGSLLCFECFIFFQVVQFSIIYSKTNLNDMSDFI